MTFASSPHGTLFVNQFIDDVSSLWHQSKWPSTSSLSSFFPPTSTPIISQEPVIKPKLSSKTVYFRTKTKTSKTSFEDLLIRGKPSGIEELEIQRRIEGLTPNEAAEDSNGKATEYAKEKEDGSTPDNPDGASTEAGEDAAETPHAPAPGSCIGMGMGGAGGGLKGEWLQFDKRPRGILADTDILTKFFVWNPRNGKCPNEPMKNPLEKEPPDPEGIIHPKFLFSRKVHKLHVTLTNLQTKEQVWDAIYAGDPENVMDPAKAVNGTFLSKHASFGSAYELSADAPPSGGNKPYFRYICPPITNKTRFKLCLEDADSTGYFQECHMLVPGKVAGADSPNPDLVPKVPHTFKWDGMLPVKGLGKRIFGGKGEVFHFQFFGYVAGGNFQVNITPDSAEVVKANAAQVNEQLKLGLVKVKTGPQSPSRFGRPRYPLYIGAMEDESKTPTVPLDLFGDCTPAEEEPSPPEVMKA